MSQYKFSQPLLMPRGTHYGNNYWVFHSFKLGRRVTAFSNLEYFNLITLEMDPDVKYYCEQPLEAALYEDGKECKTVFDVWVLYQDDREELQEVKYQSELDPESISQRVEQQLRRQKVWCQIHHYHHVIRTEKDILIGPYYIDNLTYLAAKVRRFSESVYGGNYSRIEQKVLNCLETRYQTLQTLVDTGIFPDGYEIDALAMMYYKGHILFKNMESTIINGNTEVYLR